MRQRLALSCECKQSGASNSAYLTRALTRFAKGRSEENINRSRQQNYYAVVVVAAIGIAFDVFFSLVLSHTYSFVLRWFKQQLCALIWISQNANCAARELISVTWNRRKPAAHAAALFNPPSLRFYLPRSFLSPKQSGTRRTKPYFGEQLNQRKPVTDSLTI
jgi:hypothetical protein